MEKYKTNVITESFIAEYFSISYKEACEIHKKLELIAFDNQEVIVSEGDEADGLYFIDEGKATVINEKGESINELDAGEYFGEYAILAGEKRLSSVLAHGKTTVYRLSSRDFLKIVSKYPQITGRLLKQVYGQITTKHTKLVSLTHKSRGITWVPDSLKDMRPRDVMLTYGIVGLILIIVVLLSHLGVVDNTFWKILPVIFFIGFTLRTRRIIEGMILTLILLEALLNKGNFIVGFGNMIVQGIGNEDTATTIVIMTMVECVAALLTSVGVVVAFRKFANRRIKTKTQSLFGMLFILIVVCIDECLNVVTAGICLNEVSDRLKIPRENRAILASFSTAICSMIPFSLWGAYINGWLGYYSKNDNSLFLRSILFNFVGYVVILFSLMLCFGILPKSKKIKEAHKRVENGGNLWPDGSENYFEEETDTNVVGKLRNLFLPMLVWIVSSVLCGFLSEEKDFTLGALYGLIITLIFMFVLYVGQRILSPKAFFEKLTQGIENAVMPILLYIFAERISVCLELLGFNKLLSNSIEFVIGEKYFLIPVILFVVSTVLCMGLGSCWGMYGLVIPVTLHLSGNFGINPAICLGAVLASGLIGEALSPYIDETSPAITSIGCHPEVFRRIRFDYWVPIGILSIAGYLILGLIFV